MRTFINDYCIIRDFEVLTRGNRIGVQASTVDEFLSKLYEKIDPPYPKFYKMDKQSKFGFLAAEALLASTPLPQYSDTVAVVLANSNASLDTDIKFDHSTLTLASPSFFVYTLPNIVVGEICIRHKINGENAFFVSPSFDAHTMESYVTQLFQDGPTRACIAGWVDVLGDSYDVFLYLVEREQRGFGIPHQANELAKLYNL